MIYVKIQTISFIHEERKGYIMRTFVEFCFGGEGTLCSISIFSSIHKRDNRIDISISDDYTFTINETTCVDCDSLNINQKGFVDLLKFCRTLSALKRSMPIEMFLIRVLSNTYIEQIKRIISVLADTNCINIIGWKNIASCDYINIDLIRNGDKTLNFYIDVVNYADNENKILSFELRNGKMCKFNNINDAKIPIEIYNVLNFINTIDDSFTDEDIMFPLGCELNAIAANHDISIRNDII